jgi:Ribbon-helix-helix protein, copG family
MMRYARLMRTTVSLADDVAAAVERLRRERSIGVSEAVNELVRAGLARQHDAQAPFRQKAHDLGRGIGFDNIADTLETLDGPSSG